MLYSVLEDELVEEKAQQMLTFSTFLFLYFNFFSFPNMFRFQTELFLLLFVVSIVAVIKKRKISEDCYSFNAYTD